MLNKPLYTFDNVKIYGNNHDIPLVYWYELTDKEKKEFDYINDPESNFTGFRYKGNVYGLDEFMRVENYAPDWMKKFDGYKGDSFFSGILVKFTDYHEFVRVYTYIS
jgi:hypothetical protein